MKRLLVLAVAAALAGVAWTAYARQQDGRAGREFAEQAAVLRKTAEEAVTFLSYAGARGRAPEEDEFVIWERRTASVDADARGAARRLRTSVKRDAALRWVAAYERLRSARVASRAIIVSRALYDYCTERQQFVGRAVRALATAERAAALQECFDQPGADGASGLRSIRSGIEELEREERAAWRDLLAVAPEGGP